MNQRPQELQLELARLAKRDQEERGRALRRERIERVVDAVDQLVDAAIAAEDNPNIGRPAYQAAHARLRTAIALSGLSTRALGVTRVLTHTARDKIEAQAESAKSELAALLEAVDRGDEKALNP